jgi:Uncharacterized conserved small protein
MIKRITRLFVEKIEKQISEEQQKIIQRFENEKQRDESNKSVYIDPNDKGSPLGEYGFRIKGPEPTRYGDWERKGRVSDF